MRSRPLSFATLAFAVLATSAALAADGQPWHVTKATGDILLIRSDRKTVALTSESELQAGDTIQTGPTGRVMLTRGEERIVVSPNTSIGVPLQNAHYPSTITQQRGTILLEVERKNVQHFEVETPYLAAVVKGTMFRVTVDRHGSKVDVLRGQVQVADFKTGQTALVAPGQAARVRANGLNGLSLSGRGKFSPIERGTPRTPSVQASSPKPGTMAQAKAAVGDAGSTSKSSSILRLSGHGVRIGSAIGDVKLDFHKVTKGLAHSSDTTRAQVRSDDRTSAAPSVESGFTSGSLNASVVSPGANGNVISRGTSGNTAGPTAGNSSGSSGSNAVAQGSNKKDSQVGAGNDDGNNQGNGKGNAGNGKGNGGNNGNGNGNGNGGTNGNGNGNNGNGNGKGKTKS